MADDAELPECRACLTAPNFKPTSLEQCGRILHELVHARGPPRIRDLATDAVMAFLLPLRGVTSVGSGYELTMVMREYRDALADVSIRLDCMCMRVITICVSGEHGGCGRVQYRRGGTNRKLGGRH